MQDTRGLSYNPAYVILPYEDANRLPNCNGKAEGAWMYYSLNREKSEGLLSFLKLLTSDKEDCICKLCDKNEKQPNNNQCIYSIKRGVQDE